MHVWSHAATLLVLGIAVPTYFGGRIATLEAAVTEELDAIHRAQALYLMQHGHYCETLTALSPEVARLGGGTPHGYVFTMTATGSSFTVTAEPQPYYGFSRRTIHLDHTGEVRYSWSTVQSEEIK
jgi:hypothetical protein